MGALEIVVGIILSIAFLLTVFILVRKWGRRFLYILLAGFGLYILSVDIGLGISVSFIIILSYLAKKFGDFDKK